MQTALQHEQAIEAAIEARYQYRTTDELWADYQTAQSESDAYSRAYDDARANRDAAATAAAADAWNKASDEANAIYYALSVR
jgi:hypothetical protein